MVSGSLSDVWNERLRATLESYDEGLLRRVAQKLCRPRNHWPVAELLDRCLGTIENVAALDRRLKELEPVQRMLLALMAHSRQSTWQVGSLVEMLTTLGAADGLGVVQSLLETGLLFPRLLAADARPLAGRNRLKQFDAWLALALPAEVFAPPAVMERILAFAPELPAGPEALDLGSLAVLETDGLEWPLRLAVVWQQVTAAPLRRTQQRDFFKRDLDRLRGDPLLGSLPPDSLTPLPDPAFAAVALALASGLLVETDGEIHAASFPAAWSGTLPALVASLWEAWPRLDGWNPGQGWKGGAGPGNPYPSACLLALVLLAHLPEGKWARPDDVERWIVSRHPYWNAGHDPGDEDTGGARRAADSEANVGLAGFLLGVAHPLRLLQAARRMDGKYVVRLSPMGRWVLGLTDSPPALPTYPQTLLVQPNLEILAYRQGLTPELITRLTRCAAWQTLGAACTLQLGPDTVYRALESGETLESILQIFQRHGMKAVPGPVLDSLRTWSKKRDRISVYPSAALFEFPGPAELADALARGLPAIPLTERLALVANEEAIDFRQFRLTGTRDYALPPEKCIDVDSDGVTLSVDLARSDLLLETEIQGLAEPLTNAPPGRRLYRLTPASLAAARQSGWSLTTLESWFQQRTGGPLPPAALLLFVSGEVPPLELRRQLVLHVANPVVADGLEQWPLTRRLIEARLGPTSLAVFEDNLDELRETCTKLHIELREP